MTKAAGAGENDSRGAGEAKNTATSSAQPANAGAPNAAAAKAEPSSAELATELQEMRDMLESQTKQLQEQQRKMQQLEEQLNDATAAKENLTSQPGEAAIGPTIALAAGDDKKPETPNSISVKGITLTPSGFMAAETAWRERGLTADVNTPFNAIPFSGATGAHVSEFMASGRQSRIAMLVEGKLSNVKIGGYYETDFLSAGTTSNYNQSNSFTLRQRQFWGQAAFNSGWTITGGQMWSLVTETKKGMDNRTEATPMVIDAQYNVGFSWMRQYGLRVTKNFDNKVWLGFAVENGETTATFHGQNANFVYGNTGQGGGLLNNQATFAYTKAPDFVFKAVFEPGFGHYEIFGVVSTFRDRIYPCYTATVAAPCGLTDSAFPGSGAFNDSRVGGGIGANARATFFKKVDLGIHFLGGDGVGRYGTTSLSDVTARLDGTLAPIRAFQGLGTIELHPTPKLDVYFYAGGEYAARTQFFNAARTSLTVGYGAENNPNFGCNIEQATGSNNGTTPGAPVSCTGDTRDIFEGTGGFWYRFYKGTKGTVQFGTQYSYLERTAWKGTATGTVNGVTGVGNNGSPSAVENMVFTSFRYVLP
ncbi:MAG TPA: hypothetical protein VMM16_11960 [Verrucomicrobiae bacterium]|nr:hypothetical protein [Verrucomicrobiae bacterium]